MDLKYSIIDIKSNFIMPYEFIGSTIRGGFGVALKKISCINPSFECNGCFAKDNCIYYELFEKEHSKFRLSFNLSPKLDFRVFLFEDAIDDSPFVISAVYKMLKEIGITKDRIRVENFVIIYNNQLVYDGKFRKFDNNFFTFSIDDIDFFRKDFTLKINTPIRIKENSKFVRDDIKLDTILRSINHRYLRLKDKDIKKLSFTPRYNEVYKNLSFKDLIRYSNRQKTKMKLGGIIGEIIYNNVDEESYKLLKLGEIIGVGKQVTFGLGDISIL